MKGQAVRLVDVFALGPFMVWAATVPRLPEWARLALFVSGVLTVTYNADNYMRQKGDRWFSGSRL